MTSLADLVAEQRYARARILAGFGELDTPERRKRAHRNASTRANISGGRHSDNLALAVQELREMIMAGREGEPTSAERFAADYREARQ